MKIVQVTDDAKEIAKEVIQDADADDSECKCLMLANAGLGCGIILF
jgi:hypothetical protein